MSCRLAQGLGHPGRSPPVRSGGRLGQAAKDVLGGLAGWISTGVRHLTAPALAAARSGAATIRSSRSGRPMAPAYESDSPPSILWSPASRRGCVATLAITSRTSLTRGSSNSAPGETPRSRKVEPGGRISRRAQAPTAAPERREAARRQLDRPLSRPGSREQRDRLRSEPGRESWIRVDIDLHDLQMPSVTLGEVFKHGRDHPTRPAPRRPEIDHRWHGRGRLARERVVVGVDDPGERGLAPRASRDPCAIGPTRLRALQVGQPTTVIITRVDRRSCRRGLPSAR